MDASEIKKLDQIISESNIPDHLLNFHGDIELSLPEWFNPAEIRVLCGAGDHVHAGITNISEFNTFNVFLCLPEFVEDHLQQNINDIASNYNKQKIICFLDTTNPEHLAKLGNLLKNKVDFLDRHTNSPYLPLNIITQILKTGGEAINHFPMDNSRISIEFPDDINEYLGNKKFINAKLTNIYSNPQKISELVNQVLPILQYNITNQKNLKNKKKIDIEINWFNEKLGSFKNNLLDKLKFIQKIIKIYLYADEIPDSLIGIIKEDRYESPSNYFIGLVLIKKQIMKGGRITLKIKKSKYKKKKSIKKKIITI